MSIGSFDTPESQMTSLNLVGFDNMGLKFTYTKPCQTVYPPRTATK